VEQGDLHCAQHHRGQTMDWPSTWLVFSYFFFYLCITLTLMLFQIQNHH